MASRRLLVALCAVALFATRSESHGLQEQQGFASENAMASPDMETFFGAKPEAAQLPEALDGAAMPAKPEAATATMSATRTSNASATPRRSVSVAAGVACGVAVVAAVGVAVAVAYLVRARRGARRDTAAVQLGAGAGSP
ncbi:hypothetical protein ACP4OV_026363 [Aristida adscensionis]